MKNKKLLRINMQFFAEDGGIGVGSSAGSTNPAGNEPNGLSNGLPSNNVGNPVQNNVPTSPTGNDNSKTPSLEQLIQSAVDRATNKLGNENKGLKAQLDELMKQKLTDEERVELERKQEREQFEQEKAQFILEKNKLHAVNALAKADLNIESNKLETLVSLVMGEDENAINANVKSLSDIVKTLVQGKVDQTFKDNGRNPAGSGNPDKKSDDEKESKSLASKLGKTAKEANNKSAEVLKFYTGG